MTAPRLEINLGKIYHNANRLVKRLAACGISVTGVTKATLAAPEIAQEILRAGIGELGDSRIENIEAMRSAGITAPMTLTRSPMLSQVDRVVVNANISFNTELAVIEALSRAALQAKRDHEVILMVELGDLREGIMPDDVMDVVRETLNLPNIMFKGIGANFACRSGVAPDAEKMAELSGLADSIEAKFGRPVEIISGGNSANIEWALSENEVGRINNLRLGESILLGCETLHRQPIEGLYTDAITLIAEVIESKIKPSLPWGEIGQTAFGTKPVTDDRGSVNQAIIALGLQDTDPDGLIPFSKVEVLGASGDHLIVESPLPVGAEVIFQLNYSAMVRAMTSPFVAKVYSTPDGNIDR